jgi:hypothetical protein
MGIYSQRISGVNAVGMASMKFSQVFSWRGSGCDAEIHTAAQRGGEDGGNPSSRRGTGVEQQSAEGAPPRLASIFLGDCVGGAVAGLVIPDRHQVALR